MPVIFLYGSLQSSSSQTPVGEKHRMQNDVLVVLVIWPTLTQSSFPMSTVTFSPLGRKNESIDLQLCKSMLGAAANINDGT